MGLSRRSVLAGAAALTALVPSAFAQASGRVVVIGGGFGGMIAARTLKQLAPSVDVTLIEPKNHYITCPFSNLLLAGELGLDAISFSYGQLDAAGIRHLKTLADDVDPVGRRVTLSSGESYGYDRLILSPGIDLRWGAVEGYDRAAPKAMPHAWKAGPQTTLLKSQINAMADGGLVVISVPAAPYRCPPGPYERASLIAHYLKTYKPRSKLLVLDAKDQFSKQALFQEAWARLYPDHLEWRGASDDGRVGRVDPDAMTLDTDFDTHNADVANVIPPQKAAEIAHRAGVVDATGWCPVDATSFESTLQPGIHVVGDASIAAPMPKSAFSANLQGKVCAIQVARLLAGEAAEPTVLANTCYSYASPDEAFSISGVYTNAEGRFSSVPGAGGVSPLEPVEGDRAREAAQAADWYRAITSETFLA